MSSAQKITAAALLGVSVSLLSVGFVSTPPTVWRHVIQITPVLAAFALVVRGFKGWAGAAAPIFLMWLVLMSMIGLFLMGVKTPFSGTFTPVEIALAIAVAIFSALGLVFSARSLPASGWVHGITMFVVAGAVQYAALLLSFQPMFQHDR
jgi:hypothetical protein